MVPASTEYLDRLVTLARRELEGLQVIKRDERTERSVLDVLAFYGRYKVRISEILLPVGRKYAYYVLENQEIVVGFDNTADPLALRLQYGREAKHHQGERVPHRHSRAKAKVHLTDEMTCEMFITWLKENLLLESSE